jgi:hypothetical protein
MAIVRGPIPDSANLQTQFPPLNYLDHKHLYNVNNIMTPNNVIRAKRAVDVIHEHGDRRG